ncbi:MAG: FHA domain-containing protein [Microbacteriaceae bacterium]|nr:FHA domain-containing protein [Microbacteriaceae bacterium]
MSELTLLALRFGFLLLLWAFIFAIVYALRSDLFGQRVRRIPSDVSSPPLTMPPAPRTGSANSATKAIANLDNAKRLVITSGAKEGLEIDLTAEPITIGRSAESGLVIRDDYTSTHHARLMLWGSDWAIQDLDSTNGTFLSDVRVTMPTPVPLNTPIRIGTTSFELRE